MKLSQMIALILSLAFALFLGWQAYAVPEICASDVSPAACTGVTRGFFAAMLLAMLLPLWWHVRYGKHAIRCFMLAFVGVAVLLYQQIAYVATISDIRTVTYEGFLGSFYLFGGLSMIGVVACLILGRFSRLWWLYYLLLAALFTPLFVQLGRHAFEQYQALTGGLVFAVTLENMFIGALHFWHPLGVFGSLMRLFFVALFFCITVPFMAAVWRWVRTGNWQCRVRMGIMLPFTLSAAITLLSLPLSKRLPVEDVLEAQYFINRMLPSVKAYKAVHGVFPRDLAEIGVSALKTPRIAHYMDALSFNHPGSYYFSNPKKFCMVLVHPSIPFGYHSLTNERDWLFIAETESLENVYAKVCDESFEDTSQGLLANRLGMSAPDDPIARLNSALGSDVLTPMHTPAASVKLENTLKTMRERGEIQ